MRIKVFLILLGGIIIGFWLSLPRLLFHNPTCQVLEDAKGSLLGASIASDHQWRFPPGKKIPDKFKIAIIQFEDKRFYQHPGVDFLALFRAIRLNWNSKKVKSGGSTLTMQVIRLYRHQPRTYLEKLWEIILALRLEFGYSKEEILQMYADNAPFGSNIVGLEAASWRYYGRGSELLSWSECCTLAVLPNNPSWVRPGKNKILLERKRNQLLANLKIKRLISPEIYSLALLEPLPGKPKELPSEAPHLLEFVKGSGGVNTSTQLKSTIQEDLQNQVNQILKDQINRLNANYIHNAAALILDVENGAVLAYVGNIVQPNKPGMESDVDVIQAPRSPGSTLKPLLYASMLQEGRILPNSLVADIPTNFSGYTPKNFDLGYDGAVPASQALSRSLNVPAVRMLYDYTYPRFYDQLKKFGISTLNQPADYYGLSLILGGGEVTLWDLCGVYASLARTLNNLPKWKGSYNRGDFHGPVYSLSQVQKNKEISPELTKGSILDATSIWYTFSAMEEVQRPGDEALWRTWSSSQRIAWKTGTSVGFRDAWAIGLTPKYVVGVWVGNTTGEGRPGIIGVKAAAPILFDIFRSLSPGPWFIFPQKEASYQRVCKLTGYLAGNYCDSTLIMGVPKNGSRSSLCPFHQLLHLNSENTYRLNADCLGSENMVHKTWFVLPSTMEYFYRNKNPFYRTLPPLFPGCLNNGDDNPIGIIYPEDMAKIYLPVQLDGQKGKVVFKALHRGNSEILYWHLDKEYLGITNRFHEMALSPSIGKHQLTLEDQEGNTFIRNFEVLSPKKAE